MRKARQIGAMILGAAVLLTSLNFAVAAQSKKFGRDVQNSGWGAFFATISATPERYVDNVKNCPVWSDAEELCGTIEKLYGPLLDTNGPNKVIDDPRAVKFILAVVTNGIFVSNRSPREKLKCPATWQPDAPLLTPTFKTNDTRIRVRRYQSGIVGQSCLLELVE